MFTTQESELAAAIDTLVVRLRSGGFPNRGDWGLVSSAKLLAEGIGYPAPVTLWVEGNRLHVQAWEPRRDRRTPGPRFTFDGAIIGSSTGERIECPSRGDGEVVALDADAQRWDRSLREVARTLATRWLPLLRIDRN